MTVASAKQLLGRSSGKIMLYGLESGDAGPVWCSEGDSSTLLPLFLLQEPLFLPRTSWRKHSKPLSASFSDQIPLFWKDHSTGPDGNGSSWETEKVGQDSFGSKITGSGLVDGWEGGGGVRSKITPEFPVLATGQMESSWGGRIISSLCVR